MAASLGDENAKHILLDCLESRNLENDVLNEQWLNINK